VPHHVSIQFRQVDQTFTNSRQTVAALQGINLHIEPGEFVGLIGPSGCGKSTLLRLAAGLLTPTRGQVQLAGESPLAARSRKEIGWMSQQAALLPWRTVLQNVRLPEQVNRQNRAQPATPEQLLALVGLADFAHAYPATLSGGMQQRVALARLLATGASLWLMDEPFAALDELTRTALADELLAIWRQFRPTVLWVTHHLSEAVRMADRIVILSARPGRVQGQIAVPIHRPRDDTAPEFLAVLKAAREMLKTSSRLRVASSKLRVTGSKLRVTGSKLRVTGSKSMPLS
jgi:NitT/TauT family transport system ATP-binding protein